MLEAAKSPTVTGVRADWCGYHPAFCGRTADSILFTRSGYPSRRNALLSPSILRCLYAVRAKARCHRAVGLRRLVCSKPMPGSVGDGPAL